MSPLSAPLTFPLRIICIVSYPRWLQTPCAAAQVRTRPFDDTSTRYCQAPHACCQKLSPIHQTTKRSNSSRLALRLSRSQRAASNRSDSALASAMGQEIDASWEIGAGLNLESSKEFSMIRVLRQARC